MKTQEKWLRTPDSFYPSYKHPRENGGDSRDGGWVKASFCSLSNGRWRVCVWGADDLGYELDFDTKKEAETCFRNLPDVVTRAWFEQNHWDFA